MFEQIRNLGWDLFLGALAVAAVLLALPLVRPEIDRIVHLPDLIYVGFAVIGSVLAAVALGGIIVLLMAISLGRPSSWYEFRSVSKRDVQLVFEFMQRFFGEETPSCGRMLEWQRRNKAVLTAVYVKTLRRGRTKNELVGVFKILPLTLTAVELLESEQRTGATLSADHIATKEEEIAGLYIGDVGASTRKGKSEVLRRLKYVVEQRLRPDLPIYTRPLTGDGARLVRKYNFVPMMREVKSGSLGRIHRLVVSKGGKLDL